MSTPTIPPATLKWRDVQGWFDFADIYDEAVATAPNGSTLIEVGAFFGRSALYMAEKIRESGKNLKFYVVDRWQHYPDMDWMFQPDAPNPEAQILRQRGSLFEAFAYHLERSGLSEYIRVLRMSSLEAAELFLFKEAHFVFIDADHSYAAVKADLEAWSDIVAVGGIFAGHDYNLEPGNWDGVREAVHEFFCGPVRKRNNSWFVTRPDYATWRTE